MNVIYYKVGDVDCFDMVLKQARRVCRELTELIVIGDRPMNDSTFVDIEQYRDIIQDFSRDYVHMSTNPKDFEFQSMVRWLVMEKAVEDLNLSEFFVSDWDVMLFRDITETAEVFKSHDFTLSKGESGGNSFWFSLDAFRFVCDSIRTVYRDKDSEESKKVFAHYQHLQEQGLPGGVCDMTILKGVADSSLWSHGDTSQVINGHTCDHNWLMLDGYRDDHGKKKVLFENGKGPFFLRADTGEKVACDWVHCSAHTRPFIPMLFDKYTRYNQ